MPSRSSPSVTSSRRLPSSRSQRGCSAAGIRFATSSSARPSRSSSGSPSPSSSASGCPPASSTRSCRAAMDVLANLLGGFGTALRPEHLLFAAIGVTLGTLVGVLPGIGPALTVALLLPLTYDLDPIPAFIMFAGIYYGGMYGGSTTSILLNTPGESASVVTALEGFKMAMRGRGGAALATAAIGSFVAGTISTLAITFLAPVIADVAIKFQPADYFALMVLAFASVTALVGRSLLRGLISLFLGLFIGLIGIDRVSGQARYTLGIPQLLDGLDIVVVAVGLFAVGEALYVASRLRSDRQEIVAVEGSVWM